MKSLSHYPGIVNRERSSLVLFALALLVAANCEVGAAPVTLQFNATIDTVFTGNPFDSGVSFVAGDIVLGKFTFEPIGGDGTSSIRVSQNHTFRVSVDGVELASESYEITADDDDYVFDFEPATILDQLELRGIGIGAVDQTGGTNIDPRRSSFEMNLWADSPLMMGSVDVLEPAHIPEALDKWNAFDAWRNLQLILRDGQGGSVGFSATVRDFFPIPEPSEPALAVSTILGVLLARSGFRTRN
jgi:hypothetical protein